jgi:hypothetical protein
VKPTITATVLKVPPKARFTPEVTTEFLSFCKAAGGSAAKCECILDRQELRPVENHKIEKGQAFAELFALEVEARRGNGGNGVSLQAAMNHAVPLPLGLIGTLEACKSA